MRQKTASTGKLDPGVIRKDALIGQTIKFVRESLLPWRDDPERPEAYAEEELNGYFCDFLAARAPELCPMVTFRHEQRQSHNRRVDLAAKPGRTVIIQGVTYTKYTPILVIEGKRLPSPSKAREREYVSGGVEKTGGIQRFKLGLHGKDHESAILLGYIQEGTPTQWHTRINHWIRDFGSADPQAWTVGECLSNFSQDRGNLSSRSISVHPRNAGCRTPEIRLIHFWVSLHDEVS